ncbi:unnamed protein product [Ranitomeya imitator]|uniref:Uncharacterized protein n=1 Tax=Ranitomeya imitator TaxID=111125 RepID=A0ABN9L4Z6_9NEOB|nr:unnamed protein product [Ranitomeya imitator]
MAAAVCTSNVQTPMTMVKHQRPELHQSNSILHPATVKYRRPEQRRRVMGVRTCESRCLFSGSKGEVCCIEPLHTKPELRDHPITQFSLLAMASLTKILVIGLKPSLKVWMTFPYGRMDPSSVPLLAWHFVILQGALNPMLAFCRGDVVHFLLCIVKRKMRVTRLNNADELKAAIRETWASITSQQCHWLISSMPHRIDAAIDAKGASSKQ